MQLQAVQHIKYEIRNGSSQLYCKMIWCWSFDLDIRGTGSFHLSLSCQSTARLITFVLVFAPFNPTIPPTIPDLSSVLSFSGMTITVNNNSIQWKKNLAESHQFSLQHLLQESFAKETVRRRTDSSDHHLMRFFQGGSK